jgi:hypothetical protein
MWTDTVGNQRVAGCGTDYESVQGMVGTLLGAPVGTWSTANLDPAMKYGPYSPSMSNFRGELRLG